METEAAVAEGIGRGCAMTLRLHRGPEGQPLVVPRVGRVALGRSLMRSVGTGLAMTLAVMWVGTPFYGFGRKVLVVFAGVACAAGVGSGCFASIAECAEGSRHSWCGANSADGMRSAMGRR